MTEPTNPVELALLHQEVLYPVVRVRTKEAGGSGTVLYSQKNAAGEYETYVLTNHHVVDSAIEIREEWDSYLRRKVNKEVRQTVVVDRFRYEGDSFCVGQEAIEADIMAWDKEEDLALIRPRMKGSSWPFVAKLFPREREGDLRMFHPIRACGCSLLHEPFSTLGEITSLNDEIDNRRYCMASTLITFGNSGGAVFTMPDNLFLGIPSRISMQGWADAANFMGYFIPPHRWYAFLQKHFFSFIWTGDDPAEYHQRRETRKRQAERAFEALRQGALDDTDLSGGQGASPDGEDDDIVAPPYGVNHGA